MNVGAVLDSIASAEIDSTFNYLELFRQDVFIPDSETGESVRLSLLDVSPSEPKGAIVLLHGFAASTKWWQPQIPQLSVDYRVLAIDSRGSGLSSHPDHGYSFEQLADDVALVLDTLDIRDPVVIGGHSTGGAVVTEFALRHPDRVAALIVVATPVTFAGSAIVRSAGKFMRLPDALFRWAQPLYQLDPRGEASLLGLKHLFRNSLLTWDGSDKLPQVTQRALVIRGERDRVFSHESYATFAELMPNAELVDVGVSKHQVPLERPRAVLRTILRFLAPDEAERKQPTWRRDADSEVNLELLATRPWLARYPESVPRAIRAPRIPINRLLDYTVRIAGDKPAWQFGRERMTYKAFAEQIDQVAGALQARGVGPGTVVMACLGNTPHVPLALFALARCGATMVATDPDAPPEQLAQQATQTGATWLLVDERRLDSAETVRDASAVDTIIVTGTDDYGLSRTHHARRRREQREAAASAATAAHHVAWIDLTEESEAGFTPVVVDPDATALYLFTSDHDARCVALSHHNLVAATLQLGAWARAEEYVQGTVMCAAPYHTAIGVTLGILVVVHQASRNDIVPLDDWDVLLRTVWLWKSAAVVCTPRFLTRLSRQRGLADALPSPPPIFVSSGAPLSVELHETIERLTRSQIVECYGLTETAGLTHCNPLHRPRSGSVGLPLPGVEAQIRDLKTNLPLGFYEVGELYLRCEQVVDAFADTDGWMPTGDLAELDGDGYFHILGRLSHVHRPKTGKPVYLRDIEEVLFERPEIADVAVQATTDGVVACVVLEPKAAISAETLTAFCTERLPASHVPGAFHFLEELPRNYAGRLLESHLRKQLTDSSSDGDGDSAEASHLSATIPNSTNITSN